MSQIDTNQSNNKILNHFKERTRSQYGSNSDKSNFDGARHHTYTSRGNELKRDQNFNKTVNQRGPSRFGIQKAQQEDCDQQKEQDSSRGHAADC